MAPADAFLKPMPMLQGRGLRRFGGALAEVGKEGQPLKNLTLGIGQGLSPVA
jgi:DNA polymerase-3 subunit epsilon